MTSYTTLITGCSKGFGLLLAQQLAQKENSLVYASSRSLEQAPQLHEALANKSNVRLLELDVRDSTQIQRATEQIRSEQGYLNCLVNNAGYGLKGQAGKLTREALRQQFEVNLFGANELTACMLPLLKQTEKGGLLINLSSIASYTGLPQMSAYSASKAALNMISQATAIENAPDKLSVACIQPGPFETEFNKSVRWSSSQHVEEQDHGKLRSGLFDKREDPQIVVDKIMELIAKKQAGKLGAYHEIPIGNNSNFFRVLSRWLPPEMMVKRMIDQLQKIK